MGKNGGIDETTRSIAARLAHDFNNLLTPLLAYPDMIRRDLPEDSRGRELLQVIERTAENMARITQQLLELSRPFGLERREFNICELVWQVVAALQQRELPDGVAVESELGENVPDVQGVPSLVVQALERLCENGIEAMECGGGALKVEVAMAAEDKKPKGSNAPCNGSYVKVSVCDAGVGVADDVRDKIFEPFFTTKRSSARKGAGLGLTIARQIAVEHDGWIDFESTEGNGSVFAIYFPVST